MRMPAETESNTPFTIKVVWLSGGYDLRTPNPIPIAKGVLRPYANPRMYGVHLLLFGQGASASREPRPNPSKV